jgi:hypothetical protein
MIWSLVIETVAVALPSWPAMVTTGALAGLVAAVVMNWPMSRQPDGFTPAAIAAGVVSRQSFEDVSVLQLVVVHHAAGILAGVFYGVVVLGLAAGMPGVVLVGSIELLAHLLAVGLVVVFIYSFFAHFVLSWASGRAYEEQSTAIRGQWLRSSLVFGLTLAIVAPPIAASVAG